MNEIGKLETGKTSRPNVAQQTRHQDNCQTLDCPNLVNFSVLIGGCDRFASSFIECFQRLFHSKQLGHHNQRLLGVLRHDDVHGQVTAVKSL